MSTRTYLALLVVRFYLALQPSYIHPDENFQGPEVVAGMSPLPLLHLPFPFPFPFPSFPLPVQTSLYRLPPATTSGELPTLIYRALRNPDRTIIFYPSVTCCSSQLI